MCSAFCQGDSGWNQMGQVLQKGSQFDTKFAECTTGTKQGRGFPGGSTVKSLPAVQELQAMRVRSLVGKIPWRRAWKPTPVFLPRESYGQRNLVGYSP